MLFSFLVFPAMNIIGSILIIIVILYVAGCLVVGPGIPSLTEATEVPLGMRSQVIYVYLSLQQNPLLRIRWDQAN